jgi:hypothetical protein
LVAKKIPLEERDFLLSQKRHTGLSDMAGCCRKQSPNFMQRCFFGSSDVDEKKLDGA